MVRFAHTELHIPRFEDDFQSLLKTTIINFKLGGNPRIHMALSKKGRHEKFMQNTEGEVGRFPIFLIVLKRSSNITMVLGQKGEKVLAMQMQFGSRVVAEEKEDNTLDEAY